MRPTLALAACTLALAACDPLGLDEEARIRAAREAEGKAIGSACRHSGRALEECYGLNPKTSKAAIFAGWLEMDGYMRENKIEVVSPEAPEPANKKPDAAGEKPKAADAPAEEKKAAEAPKEPSSVPAPAAPPGRVKAVKHIT